MNFTYNKITKTIEILGDVLDSILINDIEVTLVENKYTFQKDGVYKLTLAEEDTYLLVIEYSKGKNRSYLINILDNTNYYEPLSPTYIRNRKIISEIEHSFASGNIRRVELLLKELSWK